MVGQLVLLLTQYRSTIVEQENVLLLKFAICPGGRQVCNYTNYKNVTGLSRGNLLGLYTYFVQSVRNLFRVQSTSMFLCVI